MVSKLVYEGEGKYQFRTQKEESNMKMGCRECTIKTDLLFIFERLMIQASSASLPTT
jgi:mRNA-degrading endonuclease YafQ of YafQ-DinJ toxin-antitoxin module